MKALLGVSRAIDGLNERVGRLIYWCVLVMVLVSAANATSRYALDVASNAWLELQWYLFSAVFLLCAGYTLLHNEHIRIDIVSSLLRAAPRSGSTSSARCSSCCRWRPTSCGCPGRSSWTPGRAARSRATRAA